MPKPKTAARSTPGALGDCPCPEPPTGTGRTRQSQAEITRSEPGIETLDLRPDTDLSGTEIERARALVKKLLRRKRDLLPPGAKLPEAEKEATYAEAAQVMARRLKRPVSVDGVRLAAASMHASNPHRRKQGAGLTALHHALLRAEAEATEQYITEVLQHILDLYFEITPEA